MTADLADLEAKENRLDEMLRQCSNQFKLLTEDADNSRLAYVTYRDIRSIRYPRLSRSVSVETGSRVFPADFSLRETLFIGSNIRSSRKNVERAKC